MRESSPDDFDEIAMPQEGELSNLDVDWFMTYDCTLSRPEKPTAWTFAPLFIDCVAKT